MKAAGKARKMEQAIRPNIDIGSASVENPLWSRDHDGVKSNHRYIRVEVNTRESAISVLVSKGALDEAQAEAAQRFRQLFEALGGSGARAIDYSREFVDGGRFPDPIGSHQIDAGKKLAAAYEALTKTHGLYAWKIVGYVCGEGRSLYEMTDTRRQRDTLTDNLRTYLDVLAKHWGLATTRKGGRHG